MDALDIPPDDTVVKIKGRNLNSNNVKELEFNLFEDELLLVCKTRERVVGSDALAGKTLLALYFSASWCPPCTEFTSKLAEVYQELMKRGAPFEVIYVPFDKTDNAMTQYVNTQHGDWLCVPRTSPSVGKLTEKYNITAIPKLIIMKPSGEVVTQRGRKEVEDRGVVAFRNWMSAAGINTAKSNILDDLPTTKGYQAHGEVAESSSGGGSDPGVSGSSRGLSIDGS